MAKDRLQCLKFRHEINNLDEYLGEQHDLR